MMKVLPVIFDFHGSGRLRKKKEIICACRLFLFFFFGNHKAGDTPSDFISPAITSHQ